MEGKSQNNFLGLVKKYSGIHYLITEYAFQINLLALSKKEFDNLEV